MSLDIAVVKASDVLKGAVVVKDAFVANEVEMYDVVIVLLADSIAKDEAAQLSWHAREEWRLQLVASVAQVDRGRRAQGSPREQPLRRALVPWLSSI